MKIELNISKMDEISSKLKENGFCIFDIEVLLAGSHIPLSKLKEFESYWDFLKIDQYLKDLGQYRYRRHSSYIIESGNTRTVPHRAHWQSLDYNALHGGISRMFDPIDQNLNSSKEWMELIASVANVIDQKNIDTTWFAEAHQFRISTQGGLGRPTPEGAHRDGVDYVAVIMINRSFISGGETRIFSIDGNTGLRFTLEKPWTVLLLDDNRMIHETTPIKDNGGNGYRDTLVLTFRKSGFQDPIS